MTSTEPSLAVDTDQIQIVNGQPQFTPELEAKIVEFAQQSGMSVEEIKEKIIQVSDQYARLASQRAEDYARMNAALNTIRPYRQRYRYYRGTPAPTPVPADRRRPRREFPALTTVADRQQSLASRKRELARKRK